MKTENEILEKISLLKKRVPKPPDIPRLQHGPYQGILKAQIWTLEWVLGQKLPPRYWCLGCQKWHRNLRCPGCGSLYDYYAGMESEEVPE